MNLFDLSGQVAVITGSSRGIGRAIAERIQVGETEGTLDDLGAASVSVGGSEDQSASTGLHQLHRVTEAIVFIFGAK